MLTVIFVAAGIPVESLRGSRTAVFSASMLEDYMRMSAMDPDNAERTAVTGCTVACVIPNRVSWYFDLQGPSIHCNTACSSSLSAVDMACKSIKAGDATCVSKKAPVEDKPCCWRLTYTATRHLSLGRTCSWTQQSSSCCQTKSSCPRMACVTVSTTERTATQGGRALLLLCSSLLLPLFRTVT